MPAVYPDDLTLRADVPARFDQDTADHIVMAGRVRYPGIVNSVEYIPAWSLTGTATNFRTLTLFNRRTDGSGTTAVATLALTSGTNLTKYVAKAITITSANAVVAPGDVLEWRSSATGSGAADPGGQLVVQQSMTF